MESQELLIGIDIGNETAQIAYYDNTQFEPVLIEAEVNVQADAITKEEVQNSSEVKPQDDKAPPDLQMSNDGRVINACMELIKKEFTDDVDIITLCLENYTRERAKNIHDIVEGYGIKGENIFVQSYKQSYLHFVLSQNTELWVNDVGLFDYGTQGLIYRQLAVDRRKNPYIVGIMEKDYSKIMPYEDTEDSNRGYVLENIADNAIHKQILSSIYVTGIGFDGEWADVTLKKLCRGRRVFKGQNLYVNGACYTSKRYSKTSRMPEFIFIDEDMIPVHVSVNVYADASRQELIIAKAGTLWYDIDNSIYVIPDGENEIQINITNVITRAKAQHFISLDFLNPERLDMRTRLRLRIRFQDMDRCIVTVTDEGFGEILKTSRRICERIIELGGQ